VDTLKTQTLGKYYVAFVADLRSVVYSSRESLCNLPAYMPNMDWSNSLDGQDAVDAVIDAMKLEKVRRGGNSRFKSK